MTRRDMTKAQFIAKVHAHGMTFSAFGYVNVTDRLMVYRFNAGDNRRAQLAYLLAARDRDLAAQEQGGKS